MENRSRGRFFNELVKIRREINSHKNQIAKDQTAQSSTEQNSISDRLFREVSERQKVEKELSLSKELFFKLFHGSPLMMTITTIRDGMFLEVNDAFLATTGYNRDEVSGQPITGLGIFDQGELQNQIICNGGPNNGPDLRGVELNLRTKSGELRVVNVSVETIDFSDQVCHLSVMRDLSEIRSLQQEMARLGQLNLLGEMAASIGHEIRNPMTTARGFLQMLGGKKECEQYKEYFDLIIEELDRANTIVSEYLSMAQHKSKHLKLQNLNRIIKTLQPLIQADALFRDINIVSELGDVPELPLIETEMRQLILNLIRNAIEATDNGGTITIRTYTENASVVLAIQDQGKGITSDLVDKLGTPFFTTKENGTGLGLAVCYNIAARHHAVINLETGEKGTTFFVRFNVSNSHPSN